MGKLPLVPLDKPDFEVGPQFWDAVKVHLPSRAGSNPVEVQARLERLLVDFVRDLQTERHAVDEGPSRARVERISSALTTLDDALRTYKADGVTDSVLVSMYSDRFINKGMADIDVRLYLGPAEIEIDDSQVMPGLLSDFVPRRVLDEISGNITSLSVGRMSDVLRALSIGCGAALRELDEIRTANHFPKGWAWHNLVYRLFDYWLEEFRQKPTAAHKEIEGDPPSPFVGLVSAMQAELPEELRKTVPGRVN